MRKQNHKPVNKKLPKIRTRKSSVKPFSKGMIALVAKVMFGNMFQTHNHSKFNVKDKKLCLHCNKKNPSGFVFCCADHKVKWEEENPQKGRQFKRFHRITGLSVDTRFIAC